MRGKAREFLCGILILLSGFFSYYVQGIELQPEKQFVAIRKPLKQDFPASLEKTKRAQITQQVKVVPGGQSIGILTQFQGVEVAGLCAILDKSGSFVNPAADAGLREGDIVLAIEGEEVRSDNQIRDFAARAGALGKPLTVKVKRGSEIFTVAVNPAYSMDAMRFQLGLIIKDSAAGIGTLTFYEPTSMVYGALGHLITESGTVRPVEMTNGKIVGANVQGIHKGRRGAPGEKIGNFLEDKQLSGTITRNTKLGIFGLLQAPLDSIISNGPLPVATLGQIHEGHAKMLTVLNEDKIEKFDIEIVKINFQSKHDGKGLVIRVTDQRLLEQAGGIIQGMSGSPIIQDGRLAGAVTHVFVNDPTRGYGVPAEWMLWEAEILPNVVNTLAC